MKYFLPLSALSSIVCLTACITVQNPSTGIAPAVTKSANLPINVSSNARFNVFTTNGKPFMQIDFDTGSSCENDLNLSRAQLVKLPGFVSACSAVSVEQMLPQKAEITHVITNEKKALAFLNYAACDLFKMNFSKTQNQYSVLCK